MAKALSPLDFNFDFGTVSKLWLADLRVLYGWYSHKKWLQKTVEGSLDCWANHWYNPSHSPGTVLVQSEQKGWQNHSGPLTSSTLLLWTVTIWSTLQSSEYQNDQTQKQFLPSSNPSHEHLTLNITTQHYNIVIYSSHILIFSFQGGGQLVDPRCIHMLAYRPWSLSAPLCLQEFQMALLLLKIGLGQESRSLWLFLTLHHHNLALVKVNQCRRPP